MRAVTCTGGELAVTEVPDPVAGRGQLVLEVLRCGICGSDLHARSHGDGLADVLDELDYPHMARADDTVVLGHEICGRVVEGRAAGLGEGDIVVPFPLVRSGGPRGPVHLTGLSPLSPGGYAEKVLVEASMSFAVPASLQPEVAVLTEPLAVAHHAVRRSEVSRKDVAIVLGCGPVGLAVICLLKARGVRTVVASDPSPGRRALATACGADVVVDPEVDPLWTAAGRRGHLSTAPQLFELAVGSMEKLRRVPGWSHLYRAADSLGAADPRRPVVFECVGVPGMLEGILTGAPLGSRVVVVGLCLGEDTLRPSMAVNKEIELRFVLGYTPLEFRDTLQLLADGRVDVAPLVTGTVGLDGVAGAFDTLVGAAEHAKILIDPSQAGTAIR